MKNGVRIKILFFCYISNIFSRVDSFYIRILHKSKRELQNFESIPGKINPKRVIETRHSRIQSRLIDDTSFLLDESKDKRTGSPGATTPLPISGPHPFEHFVAFPVINVAEQIV